MNCVSLHCHVIRVHILMHLLVPYILLQPSYIKEGGNDRLRKCVVAVGKDTCYRRSFGKAMLAKITCYGCIEKYKYHTFLMDPPISRVLVPNN